MSMNKVKLSQVIRDFIITLDHDDYVSNASDIAIRNIALRGIREIGFDIGKKTRSIKLDIESNNTELLELLTTTGTLTTRGSMRWTLTELPQTKPMIVRIIH